MFDAVRNNKRIVQGILLLITVPFALWGVDWYTRSSGGANEVARVGGVPIGVQEFQRSLREQQERLRATVGQQFDSGLLETPEARKAMLESMIVQRLLGLQAERSRFSASDEQLRQFIGSVPAFQDGGRFSMERYESAARNQGLSAVGFEARIRQDLAMQQLVEPVIASALIPGDLARRQLSLQRETREVAEYLIDPDQLIGNVKPQPDAAQKYYEANKARFEIPEQVRAEYVVLSQAALADSMPISDEEVKRWYDTHADQYQQAEERRASHILLSVPKDAPPDQKESIRAKLQDLRKQLERSPSEFENLAKDRSQDPGSASKGGDLGFFGRGMMVKPFEEAVFALKENQISEIVESDFGYHLIKLTGIKPAKLRSLDEAKSEISAELKRQSAGRKFAELADEFNNLVYEQSDSLKPAADRFKLAIQQTGWIAKGAKVSGEVGNERLLQALFAEDQIKNKRNTEALEIGPNTLMAARVVEHKPAQVPSFGDVRASIEKQLALDEASSLAQREGAEKLARLVKGEAMDVAWQPAKTVTRASVQEVVPDGLRAVFAMPADKLPRYAGAKASNGGFVLYKLLAVKAPDVAGDDNRLAGVRAQLARLFGEEDFGAYVSALRQRYPVTINASALESK